MLLGGYTHIWDAEDGCLGQRGDTNKLWAPGDVALASSVLSDLCITTPGSTGITSSGSYLQRYRVSMVLLALWGLWLPWYSTAA